MNARPLKRHSQTDGDKRSCRIASLSEEYRSLLAPEREVDALAVALALKAIEHGQGSYFVRAYDLMEDLRRARIEHNLDRRLRVYLSPKVLVVDEFGIWPYDREPATAFFTLVSARYERGSKPAWLSVMHDKIVPVKHPVRETPRNWAPEFS